MSGSKVLPTHGTHLRCPEGRGHNSSGSQLCSYGCKRVSWSLVEHEHLSGRPLPFGDSNVTESDSCSQARYLVPFVTRRNARLP